MASCPKCGGEMRQILICQNCYHTRGFKVKPVEPITPDTKPKCPCCGSGDLWQAGYVYVGAGRKRYRCKNCKHLFTVRLPLGKQLLLRQRAKK